MQKFAKIENGTIHVPQNYPGSIELDGKTVNNPTEEQYRAAGYLPLEESEPEEQEGKVAIATYAMNKGKTKIVQSWEYEDAPEEVPHDQEEPEPTPAPKGKGK